MIERVAASEASVRSAQSNTSGCRCSKAIQGDVAITGDRIVVNQIRGTGSEDQGAVVGDGSARCEDEVVRQLVTELKRTTRVDGRATSERIEARKRLDSCALLD